MSRSRRGSSGLSGVLIVDKPAGVTSHDVVNTIRRVTGERRVGHAGTLDPAATGVLVVLVGPATRLAPYLTAQHKGYEARIVFGASTDTDDAEGRVLDEAPVPEACGDVLVAHRTLAALVGSREQVPPSFSAIKRDGLVAHRAARSGDPLALESRTIEIIDASMVAVDPGPPVAWYVRLTVSKGTYIRAIARDLGPAMGTLAHLGALRRTSSGAAGLSAAHSLDIITSAHDTTALFADPVPLLASPVIEVDPPTAARVSDGVPLEAASFISGDPQSGLYSIVGGGRLLALYRKPPDSAILRAETVLPGGVAR